MLTSIGQRIRELRILGGLSQQDLADILKVSKQTVYKYETGIITNIPSDKIEIMASLFQVTPSFIMGWNNPNANDNLQDIYLKYPNIKPITTKKVPMLGKIACGEPIYADEDFDTFIEVNSDLKADFCLTCSGDSMINANIFDGDIVFIQKQDIVDNGQIAAVIIEDEATLKRVYYDRDNGRLTLQAENPKYNPLVYIGEELNNIRILGRAISLYRKIR